MGELIANFNYLQQFFSSLIAESARLYPDKELPKKPVYLIHSALSAFGYVPGGAKTLIKSLLQAANINNCTIVMPAHSDDSFPRLIGLGSCAKMGAVSERFRQTPGVIRSRHPQLSFCAKGPLAKKLLSCHEAETGLGFSSPNGRLLDADAGILMFGADWNTCTLMHLAEYAHASTDRVQCGAFKPGIFKRFETWEDIPYQPELFDKIGKMFEERYPDKVIRGELPDHLATLPTGRSICLPTGRYKAVRAQDLLRFSIDIYPLLR